jgi:nitrate/nitrite transporter NarK
MRSFHFNWFAFFLSFFAWFAINPMVVYVRVSIGLCSNGGWDVLTSPRQCICAADCNRTLQNANIINVRRVLSITDHTRAAHLLSPRGVTPPPLHLASPVRARARHQLTPQTLCIHPLSVPQVVGAICMRLFMGTWVENSGPRFSMAFVTIFFALPVAGISLVTNAAGFIAARFFIGGIGSAFVVCQFWSSVMFSPSIVGRANATVGGWGNLGGGVTQIVMSQVAAGLSVAAGYSRGWRYSCLLPAGLLVMIGVSVVLFADDVPEGRFKDLYESGQRKKQSYSTLILAAARDPRVW